MAKRTQAVEAKETPLPWNILERNQKLRDGREVVDIAGDTSKSPENWEIVATKMLFPDARRMIAAMRYCASIPTEALERQSSASLNGGLLRVMTNLIAFVESHKAALIGNECAGEEYAAAVKPAVLARDQAKNANHALSEPDVVTYQINEPEARGEIKIERSPYGIYIHVNGKRIAMVDLFYFSPRWKSQAAADEEPHEIEDRLKQGSDLPQIVLYIGDEHNDPIAHVRWKDGKVMIESDMPCAMTEAVHGPGEVIQRLTVGEEIEAKHNEE
jgi:hypothetical protein